MYPNVRYALCRNRDRMWKSGSFYALYYCLAHLISEYTTLNRTFYMLVIRVYRVSHYRRRCIWLLSALKPQLEKSLDSATSHAPTLPSLSLAFHEGPFAVGVPSTGDPSHLSIVKCARRKLPPTLPGTNGLPPAVLHPPPFFLCEPRTPTSGSPTEKKLPLLLLLIEPIPQWT